jgi:3-deoxy-D-manno-octulosonate 8-phosphate phosphatase (KDO 8-P phosphatase)
MRAPCASHSFTASETSDVKGRRNKNEDAARARGGERRSDSEPRPKSRLQPSPEFTTGSARTARSRAKRVEPAKRLAPAQRLQSVRLLALDVDGVLTDGSIAYGAHGPADQIQRFHVQDGIALRWLADVGVKIVWISGRGCSANVARAKELGIDALVEKSAAKDEALRELQARFSISVAETAAMGDDLPDLALARASGFFAAPANAVAEVKARADLVTRAAGGSGAVRELCEAILRARRRWQAIVDAAVR